MPNREGESKKGGGERVRMRDYQRVGNRERAGATEAGELAGECCRHQSARMQTRVCVYVCV